jgi:metal-responsive CopG/Arc/MetJ family transcriptional regulator
MMTVTGPGERPKESLDPAVIPKYDNGMKTAISLPDDLFETADALAERLGVSRSRLYADAVAEYLAKHRDDKITQRLNAVYGEEDGSLAANLRRAQARSLKAEEW